MKPLKKTIVFMFYCKDVKYDMCELKKKIIRKIKYAKNLNDLMCFLNGSISLCLFFF